jgi:hypothetical protein
MGVGKPRKTHRVEPVEDPVPKEQPQEPSKQRPPPKAPSQPIELPARRGQGRSGPNRLGSALLEPGE